MLSIPICPIQLQKLPLRVTKNQSWRRLVNPKRGKATLFRREPQPSQPPRQSLKAEDFRLVVPTMLTSRSIRLRVISICHQFNCGEIVQLTVLLWQTKIQDYLNFIRVVRDPFKLPNRRKKRSRP